METLLDRSSDFAEELESAAFSLDWERMELYREPTLEEVLGYLDGASASYKFSLLGSNAVIAVDGIGGRRPSFGRPRILGIREPS